MAAIIQLARLVVQGLSRLPVHQVRAGQALQVHQSQEPRALQEFLIRFQELPQLTAAAVEVVAGAATPVAVSEVLEEAAPVALPIHNLERMELQISEEVVEPAHQVVLLQVMVALVSSSSAGSQLLNQSLLNQQSTQQLLELSTQ